MKNRKEIQQKMLEKGIQVGYHYQPNHWLSLFKDKEQNSLPVTDTVFPELLSLPLHPDLNVEDVDFITSKLINTLTD